MTTGQTERLPSPPWWLTLVLDAQAPSVRETGRDEKAPLARRFPAHVGVRPTIQQDKGRRSTDRLNRTDQLSHQGTRALEGTRLLFTDLLLPVQSRARGQRSPNRTESPATRLWPTTRGSWVVA
jgi:hypothetical protein